MDTRQKEHPTGEQDPKTLKLKQEIRDLEDSLGPLEELVNVAKRTPGISPTKQVSKQQLDQVMEVAFPDRASQRPEEANRQK